MPIDFASIPAHIKISILQKQDAGSFASFRKSSGLAYDFTKYARIRVPLKIQDLYVKDGDQDELILSFSVERKEKIVSSKKFLETSMSLKGYVIRIDSTLTSDLCESLVNVIRRSRSSFYALAIGNIACSPREIHDLVEVSGAKRISIDQIITADFINAPAISNMDHIEVNSTLDDENLQSLKMDSMSLFETNVSNHGINAMIKDWFNGRRSIFEITISTSQRLEEGDIFDGMPYSLAQSTSSRVYCIENEENNQIHVKFNDHSIVLYEPY